MNTSKAQTASPLLGLGYLAPVTGSLTFNSVVLGPTTASAVVTQAVTLPGGADILTLTRVQVNSSGNGDVDGWWVMVYGSMSWRTANGDGGIVIKRGATQMTISMQYYNGSLANKTIPTQVVNYKVYPYSAPWD